MTPAREFSVEFCNGGNAQLYKVMPLPDGGKSLHVHSSGYNTKMRRVKRQTDLLKQYRALHA